MEIIGTLIVGFIAGVIAKLLMPGKDPGGCIITIILGIVGAFVATYLGKILGIYEPGDTAGFIGATIGAMIILFLYRLFLKKK
ncbi:MAG TPA: GlsB/YeaQ/YmgE family stress response membrane protein [Ignavibacteriaceae bacterium]|nr:GlsB/YeaQ/YmgE family stress response membrane protein [Ignavibacteriaceae bacterium]